MSQQDAQAKHYWRTRALKAERQIDRLRDKLLRVKKRTETAEKALSLTRFALSKAQNNLASNTPRGLFNLIERANRAATDHYESIRGDNHEGTDY